MSSFRDFEHRAPVGGALRTGLRLGGRLDRYVAELFVGSYAVALLLVVGIFVIINLASNIDEYLRAGPDGSTPSGWLVVKLYIYQTPFLFLEVAPFVTLVGGLFTASRLMKNREVVAGLAAGVSVRRMLLPVFLIGGLLGAGMFGFREWVAESLGGRRDALLDYLVERRPEEVLENLWVKDPKGNPVRVEAYYPGTWGVAPRLEGLGATLRKGNSWTNVVATRAVFDKARNVWDLEVAPERTSTGAPRLASSWRPSTASCSRPATCAPHGKGGSSRPSSLSRRPSICSPATPMRSAGRPCSRATWPSPSPTSCCSWWVCRSCFAMSAARVPQVPEWASSCASSTSAWTSFAGPWDSRASLAP